MLAARIRLALGDLDLDVELTADDGEVVALLGPNGAGKTTALRAVAGLRPIDDGRIELDGRLLDEPASQTFVPTAERRIGMVFQDHLLFPHLTALDNVAFGLQAGGTGRADARVEARRWLDRFGLGDRADDRPATLSGGEAQRVALARSLAPGPRLLLLDEPLAALDAATRPAVRTELRRHLDDFAGARVLVTHDPVDAVVLADRLVIVEAGRTVQTGTAAEVTSRPASQYVARLVGLNLVHGTAVGDHQVRLETGGTLTIADPPPGPEVAVAIRPQAVALHRHRPEGSPRNAWEGTVAEVESHGDRVRVTLAGPVPLTAELTPQAVADLALDPGVQVWATVKAVDLTVYER